ncbi:Imm26 family immunity protein [Luteimicrobium sp. NPDC057192]|uniref:Imm26 family immunity protein n=1 Tax=Luteimicrobium sp. NPDC057192 TaxID=3346042 RepID=UPI0036424E9D
MARVNYREGHWFAVPLRDGGFALGLVARANRDGVLFGYFFGPWRDELPSLTEAQGLAPDDAVLVGKFGHLGLKQGRWRLLGRDRDWDRDALPMPAFVRYEELTGRSLKVTYDDDDPNRLVRVEEIPSGAVEQGPKEGLMGAGFVEKVLTAAACAGSKPSGCEGDYGY